MSVLKCPECGKIHRKQNTAHRCFSESQRPLTHAIIASLAGGVDVPPEIRQRAKVFTDYYDALPFNGLKK